MGNYGPFEDGGRRSPSPEPIYSSGMLNFSIRYLDSCFLTRTRSLLDGKRLNTREFRQKGKLENERHDLVVKCRMMNPDYKAPADYRAPEVKIQDVIRIPQDEFPHVNFIGLIIGPRGNTLKMMEKDTGTQNYLYSPPYNLILLSRILDTPF